MKIPKETWFILGCCLVGAAWGWSDAHAGIVDGETEYRQVVRLEGTIVAWGPKQTLLDCEIALDNLRKSTHPAYDLACEDTIVIDEVINE